jgi:hypothetical protein
MMQIGDLLASITGEPSPTTTTFPLPKRKADDDLRRPVGKVQKTETQAANSSRPIIQPSKSSAADSSTSKTKIENGHAAVQNSTTSTFKNGQPTPPPTNDPPKVPKKGSFAEIMARAKAVQSTLGQVGKIQHKKIEKLPSKREREAMAAQKGKSIQKGLDPKGKFSGTAQAHIRDAKNGVKGHRKVGNGKMPGVEPEKKVKKAAMATTGYAGTARPKPGASKLASRSMAGSSSSRDRDRLYDRGSSRRYGYASEEDEDEEMEEEDDYYSDESDMEAAAFEVDDEEEEAARIARKEDAEALAEENRHKREKLEKKRRLEAMAKKAPGQRY